MTLSPQRLDKAAEALRQLEQGGKKLNGGDTLPKATKKKWCDKASVVVSAYLGDTHVDVPREPEFHDLRILVHEPGYELPAISSFTGAECKAIYSAMLTAELTERDAG